MAKNRFIRFVPDAPLFDEMSKQSASGLRLARAAASAQARANLRRTEPPDFPALRAMYTGGTPDAQGMYTGGTTDLPVCIRCTSGVPPVYTLWEPLRPGGFAEGSQGRNSRSSSLSMVVTYCRHGTYRFPRHHQSPLARGQPVTGRTETSGASIKRSSLTPGVGSERRIQPPTLNMIQSRARCSSYPCESPFLLCSRADSPESSSTRGKLPAVRLASLWPLSR